MESKKVSDSSWVIRLQRGDRIVESLVKFCTELGVEGGFFYGIGAVDEVELALYDVALKKYHSKKFSEPFEMTNITGSIGVEEKLIIHAHATFNDSAMKAYAGHLVDGRISGTGEIYLTVLPKLSKKYDDETGLKVFDLNN